MGAIQQVLMSQGGSSTVYLNQLSTTPRSVMSLRKMISTATNCIRVRRSSDNAEQDIGFTGDVLDTTSLASFVGANSAFVTTFYDQTGNGENAVQATAANQPRIVNAGVYDGKLVFDGTNDSLSIVSLTAGADQVGLYGKINLPTPTSVHILFEQSTNYNSNPQSFVVYLDDATAGKLNLSCRNTTGGSDFRLQHFPATLNSLLQLTALYDRTLTGTDEEKVWQSGSALTPTVQGSPADQTGTFTTYDLYIGARAGSSLFTAMELETLAFYNADTASIRASIESVVD